jgi:hypothetical protein
LRSSLLSCSSLCESRSARRINPLPQPRAQDNSRVALIGQLQPMAVAGAIRDESRRAVVPQALVACQQGGALRFGGWRTILNFSLTIRAGKTRFFRAGSFATACCKECTRMLHLEHVRGWGRGLPSPQDRSGRVPAHSSGAFLRQMIAILEIETSYQKVIEIL